MSKDVLQQLVLLHEEVPVPPEQLLDLRIVASKQRPADNCKGIGGETLRKLHKCKEGLNNEGGLGKSWGICDVLTYMQGSPGSVRRARRSTPSVGASPARTCCTRMSSRRCIAGSPTKKIIRIRTISPSFPCYRWCRRRCRHC